MNHGSPDVSSVLDGERHKGQQKGSLKCLVRCWHYVNSWGRSGKESACSAGDTRTRVHSLAREDPLEKGAATPSSTLAWRTPWTDEPGGLQSAGPQRAGHG